jgi:hypothetical protein
MCDPPVIRTAAEKTMIEALRAFIVDVALRVAR